MKTPHKLAAILAAVATLPGLTACSGMSTRGRSTGAGATAYRGTSSGTESGATAGGVIGKQADKPGR